MLSIRKTYDAYNKSNKVNYSKGEKETEKRGRMFLQIENRRLRSTSPAFQNALPPPPSSPSFSQDQLWDLIGASDIDLADIASVLDKAERLPWRQRAQVEQVIQTRHFRDWITSPYSTKLLIHWERSPPQNIGNISPLSTFLASLTQMFRQNGTRFIAAAWFCTENLDPWIENGTHDARAMVLGLIGQILRQHHFQMAASPFETGEINIGALQAGDLATLIAVLGWLVRELPETITLVFLIDSVASYEEDKGMREALAFLLRLVGDHDLRAAVKVVFASAPGTSIVRKAFESEDLILNIEVLPQLAWMPSEERMGRELSSMV